MRRVLIIGGYEISVKRALMIIALVALGAFALQSYASQLSPVVTAECAQNDSGCIKNLGTNVEECIPSSTLMQGRDGIWLMVNITREGNRCVRTENVVSSEKPENEYLLNHSVTCEFSLSNMGNASATACPGTIYDFVTPPPAEGSQGAHVEYDPFPHCGFYSYGCKERISSNVQNCVISEMTDNDLKWEPNGYWTGLIRLQRVGDVCQLYLEVLNAVNLPPDVPSTLIGSSMTCNISVSELPVQYVPESACDGNLYQYLYQISS
jgi:hypothetical protein